MRLVELRLLTYDSSAPAKILGSLSNPIGARVRMTFWVEQKRDVTRARGQIGAGKFPRDRVGVMCKGFGPPMAMRAFVERLR